MSSTTKCTRCNGTKKIDVEDCQICEGTGKVSGFGCIACGGKTYVIAQNNNSDTSRGDTNTGTTDSTTNNAGETNSTSTSTGTNNTGTSNSSTNNTGTTTTESTGTTSVGDLDTNYYKPSDLTEDDYQSAFEITGTIVNAVRTIGVTVAVIGCIVLGIKYMIGSVEEKAEYKKTMIPYIVGCVIIFSITTIVSILYELGSQL